MIILRASSWQLPLLTISVNEEPSVDTTIAGFFGADVSKAASLYANASLDYTKKVPDYPGKRVSLFTSGVPFFPDLGMIKVQSANRTFDMPLELRLGKKTLSLPVKGTSEGVFTKTILTQYFIASIQVAFIEARAAKGGIGLGTKEQYKLNQAKADKSRLGAMKVVWHDSSESPMRMTRDGLYVRATTSFCPYVGSVTLLDQASSALGPIVASHKTSMINYYKRLYPTATTSIIENAMIDSGISNWYEAEFKAYLIPAQMSKSIVKTPFLRQLETLSTTEAFSLGTKYLTQVVGRAVTDADIMDLQSEFFTALKRKGHSVSKRQIPEARMVLAGVVKALSGYEAEIDFGSVITGSLRWSEFARNINEEGADFHPFFWSDIELDGDVLSGVSPVGKDCSVSLPPYMLQFATLLAERRDVALMLVAGWEDFVASTYSASFKTFRQTANTYDIHTFRPLLQSCGLAGGMSPDEIIGVVINE